MDEHMYLYTNTLVRLDRRVGGIGGEHGEVVTEGGGWR